MKTGYPAPIAPGRTVGRGVPLPNKGAKPSVPGHGHLTHVSIKKAEEDQGVILGTLYVNSILATVLFDTGASHSFMAKGFTNLHGIPLVNLTPPLVVHSPGLISRTSMVTHGVVIDIGYNLFPTSLIALKSTDIDVILGMDWLTKSQAIIDCAARSIVMTSPVDRNFIWWSPSSIPPSTVPMSEANFYAIDVLPPLEIHDVPVVCVGVMDTGVSRSTCSWAPSSAHLQPRR
jgi:hypothetical protein